MRPKTLLILFLVVAGLWSFVWFYERKLPGSDERAKLEKKLLTVKKDDVVGLAIERPGADVRLERMGDAKPGAKPGKPEAAAAGAAGELAPAADWRLTKPMQARADGTAVSGLVESLVGLEKERTIDHPDLKALGLDRPQATVRMKTGGGETVVSFGAKVPTSGEVMVAVGGDAHAYAVADSVLTTLERDPGEWRDKQVFHGEEDAIDRVTLSGPAGDVLLARRGDAFWIESPAADRDRADRDLVDSLLADLTALRADHFIDDPRKASPQGLAGLGLEPPRATIEAVLKGQAQPFHLDLGAPTQPAPTPVPAESGAPPPAAIYAKAGGLVFSSAQTGLSAAAGRSAADWRSKALAGLQVYQIEAAKVTDAAGTLDLVRSGTDWKRGKDTIPYTPVSDLLFGVAGAKAGKLSRRPRPRPWARRSASPCWRSRCAARRTRARRR